MTFPLDGVAVLDFGQGAAGPYCAQLMGDYGATVIKVEPPRGDWARTMGAIDERTGDSSSYMAMNRNKRAICLDLSMPEAQALALRLASRADVVVESFRPGVMDRLGLGYDGIRAENRAVIYCSISGFGSTGPNVGLPASDSLMQPYGGLMSVVGEPGRPPLKVGNIVSDMVAGTNAFAAVLMGLFQRARSGAGARLEVALLDSIVAFQATGLTQYLMTGKAPARLGNQHPLLATSGVIEASDGYVTFAVLDHHWDRFCATVNSDEIVGDARFATSESRLANREALWEAFERLFSQRRVAEWVETLNAIDIVCGPVNDYPALVADPQAVHSALFDECEVAVGITVPMIRSPIRVDDLAPRYEPPPRLGEHSREVLATELDLSNDEIDALVERGAVIAAS